MKIGITGSIGTGKSTVSQMLKNKGYKVLDADQISHDALKKGTSTYNQIISLWDICDENQNISRVKLGKIVFSNNDAKKQLEKIIHPYVIEELKKQSKNEELVFLDIPLLYESHLEYLCDKIAVVYCNEKEQLERIINRNHYTKEEALIRMNAQMSIEEKRKKANIVIDNSKDLKALEKEIERFIENEVIY